MGFYSLNCVVLKYVVGDADVCDGWTNNNSPTTPHLETMVDELLDDANETA